MGTKTEEQETTKTKIYAVLIRLEERLIQYQDIPEEVKQLRILQKQLHNALENKRAQETMWRDALHRILKESISLLFPERKNGR